MLRGHQVLPWPVGGFIQLDLDLSTVLKSELMACGVWDRPKAGAAALSSCVISCRSHSKLPLTGFAVSAILFPSSLFSRPWLEWIFYCVKPDHVTSLLKICQWLPAICRIKSKIFWPTWKPSRSPTSSYPSSSCHAAPLPHSCSFRSWAVSEAEDTPRLSCSQTSGPICLFAIFCSILLGLVQTLSLFRRLFLSF